MSLLRRAEDHVILKDVYGLERRIKLYSPQQIDVLERAALRSHAMYLYQTLGSSRCTERVPDSREDLIAWIMRVQRAHLGFGGSPSPMRGGGGNLEALANAEMVADGTAYRTPQTTKYVLEESHSKHAEMLARRDPMMAAAILKEINDGIQKFHDGIYGGDLWLSQRKLAEDIYKELNRDKVDSFLRYKDKFLNFSVVIGNIGYSGNIPCFRYKVMYPEKFTHIYETAYISIFFTLKEAELRMLVGSADPYGDNVDVIRDNRMEAALEVESAQMYQKPNSYAGVSPSRPDLASLADAEMVVDGTAYTRPQTTKYILEESHSKHAQMLAQSNPLMAAAILREINDGIQKFHDGIYGGELFLCEKKLAEDIDKELNRDKDNSFRRYRDKFLNFSVVIGNMGYCGDIPCFRYKVMYPEKWSSVYDTAYISVFFTLRETELRRLLSGASA